MKIESKIMEHVKEVLLKFDNLYIENNQLKRNKVIQDLDSYNSELITALLSDDLIKKTYTEKILDTEIFKINQFIEMFEYKEFWEDSYTKYQNKIGLTTNGKFIDDSSDVVLDFPFKDAVLKAGMSKEDLDKDENVDEVFLNEVIAKAEIDELLEPKILVNAKKYDETGIHDIDEFNMDDNLILKGNNLIALHSIEERYAGKIKLIYLDPPYNTGSDSFAYNDRFNQSTWLTFMKNRLEIAKKFLREDGVILVSIDEKEEAYLKILMDNIFGKENFLENFHIQVRYTNKSLNEKDAFQPVMEYVLAYSKSKSLVKPNQPSKPYDIDKFIFNIKELNSGTTVELGGKKVVVFQPDEYEIHKSKTPFIDGLKETWASGSVLKGNTSGKFFDKYLSDRKTIDGLGCLYKVYDIGEDGLGYRYFTGPKKENSIRGKFYSGIPSYRKKEVLNGTSKKIMPIINWYDFSADFGNIRHEGGVNFGAGKKPEKMLKMFIDYFSNPGDLILDFFAGSGSTLATALKMNRKFIGIEQMEYIDTMLKPRLENVIFNDQTGISKEVNWNGGGSFIYAELMKKNKGFIQELQKASNMTELNSVFERMKLGADFDFRVDLEKFETDRNKNHLSFEQQKDLLFKMIDKNQLYYNESNINDEDIKSLISDTDYKFNKSFYGE